MTLPGFDWTVERNEMKKAPIGAIGTESLDTEQQHTAESVGNPGVRAISTATLVVLIEGAAHNCLLDFFQEGEISVGTEIAVKHIAAVSPGILCKAHVKLTAQDGNRFKFSVQVHTSDGKLIMMGTHARVVVNLESFIGSIS